MLSPRCPVCQRPLLCQSQQWRCENGHGFDVARQGYVNLLTVNQKRSLHPGDTGPMIQARREFLSTGIYAPIAEKLCKLLVPYGPSTVLDVGCGEGYYLGAVAQALPQAELWGMDISKQAVRRAAASHKNARWITATAAAIPFFAGSFSAVLSLFALTAAEEFARVLKPGGVLIQVLAGENHLLGLKQIIYPRLLHRSKTLCFTYDGFVQVEHQVQRFAFTLTEPKQIQNLLAMTPHYWRIDKEGAARLAQTCALTDEAEVVWNVYQKI